MAKALQDGANPNTRLGDTSALNWCIERSQVEMMACLDLLLKAGADPNITADNGDSPLMKACWLGHVAAVERLLQAGANPNHQNQDGFSALMSTSGNHRAFPKCLSLLMDAGVDLEARSPKGQTAWLVWARKGQLEAMELLLAAGCDPTCRDHAGKAAWDLVPAGLEDAGLVDWLVSAANAWELRSLTPAATGSATPLRL